MLIPRLLLQGQWRLLVPFNLLGRLGYPYMLQVPGLGGCLLQEEVGGPVPGVS